MDYFQVKKSPLLSPVSVVLATYNGALYLKAQLDSLAAQHLRPFELVVTDDGSTDDTLAIIEAFAQSATFPVRIFRQEIQLGYADNFLFGARQARGDLIAFCDQDDVWYPQKLEVCVKAMAQDGVALCVHAVDIIDAQGKTMGRLLQDFPGNRKQAPLAKTDPWHSFLGMSQVFDRNLLDIYDNTSQTRGLSPDDGTSPLGHDRWVTFLAQSYASIVRVPQSLAGYRLHGKNLSQSDDSLRRSSVQLSRMVGLPAYASLGRVDIARHRSQLLAQSAERNFGANLQRKLRSGARRWEMVARHEYARLNLYTTDKSVIRAFRFLGLVAKGTYRQTRLGGMGPKLFLKDLVIGVLRMRKVKI